MHVSALVLAASARVFVNLPDEGQADRGIFYITGSSKELCGWKPDCVRLKRVGPATLAAEVPLPAGTEAVEFKVTRGSWATEAADASSKPLPNFVLRRSDAELTVNIVNWKDSPPLGVTGELHRHALRDPASGFERDALVWVPEGKGPFRVLYAHDGQNLFDPAESNTGVDWGIDEAVTELAREGAIEPMIVVGVECGDRRMEEYDLTVPEGRAYESFLTRTVKDFVDRNYDTRKGPESTYLMGSSMGAIVSFELLWRNPEIYSRAAGLSLPVFAKDQTIYRVLGASRGPVEPVAFYMDHGDRNGDEKYEPYAQPFASTLGRLLPPGSQLNYKKIPYAGHTESDWRRRLKDVVRFLAAP